MTVPHLLYVDDTLIFVGLKQNRSVIYVVLLCFEAILCLRVNMAKSKLTLVGEVPRLAFL